MFYFTNRYKNYYYLKDNKRIVSINNALDIFNELLAYNKKSFILNGNEVDLQEAIIDIKCFIIHLFFKN